jgi:DNA repair exonuclease SbcCD ATPase subunit
MSDTLNGAATEPMAPADAGNVDKIRDILFGSQMRDYDRRFAGFEDRLLRESGELRDEVQRRLAASDQFFRGEMESLAASLSTEQRERVQAVRDAMDATANVNRELSDRVSTLAEQVAHQHRELRNTLNEQIRQLQESLERRTQELTGALRREAYELRDAKADRTALAAMFAELAQRLAGDGEPR